MEHDGAEPARPAPVPCSRRLVARPRPTNGATSPQGWRSSVRPDVEQVMHEAAGLTISHNSSAEPRTTSCQQLVAVDATSSCVERRGWRRSPTRPPAAWRRRLGPSSLDDFRAAGQQPCVGAGEGRVPVLVYLQSTAGAWAAAGLRGMQGQAQLAPQRSSMACGAIISESPAPACGPPCERSRAGGTLPGEPAAACGRDTKGFECASRETASHAQLSRACITRLRPGAFVGSTPAGACLPIVQDVSYCSSFAQA